MIWAIAGVLALVGLVFLGVAAVRLLASVHEMRGGLDRVNDRLEEAQELQERLDRTILHAERAARSLPGK